jgi:DNA-binding CsgD family transcriptional regulator
VVTLVRQERTSDATEALAGLQRRFGAWEQADRHVFGVVDIARALLAVEQGGPGEAVRVAKAALDRALGLRVYALDAYGRALVGDGRLEQAMDVAEQFRAAPGEGPLRRAFADRLTAGVAGARGDVAAAVDAGLRAAEALERLGIRADAESARLDAAELRATHGAGEGLVAEVERLLAFFAGCGRRPSADRCRRLLRSLGRRPAGGGRERGPGELSPREFEVVRLVAEGRSNAEIAAALFISRRTVTTHLQNVYARLGLGSRTALARWVVEARAGSDT